MELYFSRYEKEENKLIFDAIIKYKNEIGEKLGFELIWEKLEDKKARRIKYQKDGLNLYDEEDWPEMISSMTDVMIKIESVMSKYIPFARKELLKR